MDARRKKAAALVFGVGLGVWVGAAPVKEAALPPMVLSDVALGQFSGWDKNGDGVVSEEELDLALLNPEVKGANAAAAAAIKRFVRQEEAAEHKVVVNREFLNSEAVRTTKKNYKLEVPDSVTGLEPGEAKGATTKPAGEKVKTVATAQAMFDGARRALAHPLPPLFEDGEGKTAGVPEFSKLRQGYFGDCYLISVLGGDVHLDGGKRVAAMVKPEGDGFDVKWGDGSTTAVGAMTDGERAMGGAGLGGGLWVRVFEKALLLRKLPEDKAESTLAADGIGKGGNSGRIIELMTGHKTGGAGLFAGPKNSGASAETIEQRLKTVRPALAAAIAAKRLVELGTPKHVTLPPAITPSHAFAVLDYDAKRDVLTVWNPHANKFVPKGPAGLANGYATEDGVFEIKLEEAARCFSRITWETGEPVGSKDLKGMKGATGKVAER